MFKGQPLYLEWAPENTFDATQKVAEIKREILEDKGRETKKENENDKEHPILDKPISKESEYEEPPEENTTLFIKNLNFNTKEPTIRQHFTKLGPIHSIQVAKKPDPNNPNAKISAGYGFIQFKKITSLEKALKNLQFSELEGKKIELKRSDRILR